VVQVYGVTRDDEGQPYIVMEYVDGVTLKDWLEVRERDIDEILAVFEAAGAGLSAAHARDLVHRGSIAKRVLDPRSDHDVKLPGLSEIHAFMRTWYTPSNATLVIVGDLPVGLRARIEQQFGPWREPRGAARRRAKALAALEGLEARVIRHSARRARPVVAFTWITPGLNSPSVAEADLLAKVLEERLSKAMNPDVFTEVGARHVSTGHDSVFMVLAEGLTEARPEVMRESLESLLDEVRFAAPSGEELARARRRAAIDLLYIQQSIWQRIERMQHYLSAGRPPDSFDADIGRYDDTDGAAVESFARTHLVPNERTTLIITTRNNP
jgi:predicted Zn-dependent peptidase